MSGTAGLLSVVVPAYNEADAIVEALGRLREVLDGMGRSYEVLLVCDGSTDGTGEAARAVDFPALQVFEYSPNQGKGHALRYGAARASGELVAFIDADLDIHPACLTTLLAQLRETGVHQEVQRAGRALRAEDAREVGGR